MSLEEQILGSRSTFNEDAYNVDALLSMFANQTKEEVQQVYCTANRDIVLARRLLMELQMAKWKKMALEEMEKTYENVLNSA